MFEHSSSPPFPKVSFPNHSFLASQLAFFFYELKIAADKPLKQLKIFLIDMLKFLIHCTVCNQVIPNYPGYGLTRGKSLPGVKWSEADFAGARAFLRTHFGPELEQLLVEEDSWVKAKLSKLSQKIGCDM